ncbi:MAG: hypothetical protein ACFFBL_05155 [Promethearchaeota archaeon]
MPFVFLKYPDDDTLGKLTIIYEIYEESGVNGSDWSINEDALTYYTTANNMRIVLSSQYYLGYPLAADVESWDYGDSVTLGMHSAFIVGTSEAYSYDCWDCEINNQTFLRYDMDSGILVQYERYLLEELKVVTLMDVDLELPAPYVKDAGVLLAGIFVELAVIIWQFGQRLEKPG